MKLTSVLSILFLLAVSHLSFSQEWIRTFSMNNKILCILELAEHYDHGYILCADIGLQSTIKIGWIIKTDINGNVLWEKKLGTGMRQWFLNGVDNTPDGGIILTGVCDTLDIYGSDAFVVKLTACGDVQWCRVFHDGDNFSYGNYIRSLPDGSSVFVMQNWGVEPSQSVWLRKLNSAGETVWEQQYFQSDTLVTPFSISDLMVSDIGNYLITGTCYRPKIGQVQPDWLWPMMILADSTGEAVFETAWGHTLPFTVMVGGEGFQSAQMAGGFYSSICNYHESAPPAAPCLIKTSFTGEPLYYMDLVANTTLGKASTITKISDSVLFAGVGYMFAPTDTVYVSVLKVDTLGNVLLEKLLRRSKYLPQDALRTFDNKYLIALPDTANVWLIFHLYKLNQNLDWDSIYTAPRVYDSLCPHPIASSTLYFNCDVLVGKEEVFADSAKVRLKVWPNPCATVLHISLPERIRKQTETEHFTVTTTFHHWNKPLDLEAFDLFGRRLFHRTMAPGERELELDVSSWPRGVALLRLSHKGTAVAVDRVVVE